jgi:hypothetical protein
MVAIDMKIGTGHVTTRIAQKKDCRATILTRLIEAAEHVLGGPLLLAIGVVIGQVFGASVEGYIPAREY